MRVGPLARGDVACGADDDFHIAGGIEHGLEDVVVDSGYAAVAGEGNLAANGLFGAENIRDLPHVHVRVPGLVAQFVESFSHDLFERLRPDFEQAPIGVEDMALGIEDVGEIIRGGEDGLVEIGDAGQFLQTNSIPGDSIRRAGDFGSPRLSIAQRRQLSRDQPRPPVAALYNVAAVYDRR